MSLTFDTPIPDEIAKAENLPTLPAVALDVVRLTERDDCTLDQLAHCLQKDPAIAAKLLKLSNSSMFNLGMPVTTLQRAAMVLGMKTVKLMSLSFSLAQDLPKDGPGRFDHAGYWKRSMIAAVAGRSFSRLIGRQQADEAFLCGLFSHIGQLVMAECIGDVYEEVIEAAAGSWPSIELEERVMGFHHADIAGTLLGTWKLPDLIAGTVAYMHRPGEAPEELDAETKGLVEVMSLCTHVVAILCNEDSGRHLALLQRACEERFGLEQEEIDAFLLGLEEGIRETAEMLAIKMPRDVSHEELVLKAREQIVQISLSTTADLHQATRKVDHLQNQNEELASQAYTDKLTGLPNRAAFDRKLADEIDRRMEPGVQRALGLVMIDVDKFKVFNDTHGHQAGDEVLRMVGRVLDDMTRKGDMCARYGGEEFALILPQTTPNHLRVVANRVREAIAHEVVEFEGSSLQVTASFGGACLAEARAQSDGQALIKLADTFLYRAKENGRNRVEVFTQVRLPGRTG